MEDEIVAIVDRDLEDLIPSFIENRREDIETIKKSLATGDLDLIKRLGHTMKGTGGGYGFDGITDIGCLIEEAAISKDHAKIEQQNKALEDYLNRVKIVFE